MANDNQCESFEKTVQDLKDEIKAAGWKFWKYRLLHHIWDIIREAGRRMLGLCPEEGAVALTVEEKLTAKFENAKVRIHAWALTVERSLRKEAQDKIDDLKADSLALLDKLESAEGAAKQQVQAELDDLQRQYNTVKSELSQKLVALAKIASDKIHELSQ